LLGTELEYQDFFFLALRLFQEFFLPAPLPEPFQSPLPSAIQEGQSSDSYSPLSGAECFPGQRIFALFFFMTLFFSPVIMSR